jgi:outer membrane usher protein PapC
MNGLYALLSPFSSQGIVAPGFCGRPDVDNKRSVGCGDSIQYRYSGLERSHQYRLVPVFPQWLHLAGCVPDDCASERATPARATRGVFLPPDDDLKGSAACLTPELLDQFGLKEEKLAQLTWWKTAKCLDLSSLPGLEVSGDLSTSTLHVSLPQAYLQYTHQNWDPALALG